MGRLGIAFDCWSPHIDEAALPGESPSRTAVRLAAAKAAAAAERWPGAWIIGSDQVAEHRGLAVGKPETRENARRQLRAMRGDTVRFHSALCLRRPDGGNLERMVATDVSFRAFGDDEIERYLEREHALDCAGSAKSEGLGIALIARMDGDDPTALIGLPLIALSELLRDEGFQVP